MGDLVCDRIRQREGTRSPQHSRSPAVPPEERHPLPRPVLAVYAILGVALLVTLLGLATSLKDGREEIVSGRRALAVQTSQTVAQGLYTTVLTADAVLRDLGRAGSSLGAEERLSRLVRQTPTQGAPESIDFGVVDRRGVLVASTAPGTVGIQPLQASQLVGVRSVADHPQVRALPSTGFSTEGPGFLLVRPIPSSDGQFVGATLAIVALRPGAGWPDAVTLADDQGHPVTAVPPDSPVDDRKRIYGVTRVDAIPLSVWVAYDQDRTLHQWSLRVQGFALGGLVLTILVLIVLGLHRQNLRERDQLRELAIADPLTGIANRRYLTLVATQEIARAARDHRPAALLMVDIDSFKTINDTWGHAAGDRVIQALARTMVHCVRTADLVGRIGGEEFVAVLPNMDTVSAFVVASRIREQIELFTPVEADRDATIRFTISVGVACLTSTAATFDQILGRADRALYKAKQQGKNSVVLG